MFLMTHPELLRCDINLLHQMTVCATRKPSASYETRVAGRAMEEVMGGRMLLKSNLFIFA